MSDSAARPPTQPTRDGSRAFNALRVLRHREFRLLWVGLAISAIGTWMQIVALSLLVLKITHGSAFALGTVSLTQALAFFLFALIAGSVADRIDERLSLPKILCGLISDFISQSALESQLMVGFAGVW